MHPVAGARKLVFHCQPAGGRRTGIGHFEDSGDTAQDRRPASAFEVFLVLVARLAEMNLAVDDTRQDVKPLRLVHLGGLRPREVADGSDAPCPDTNIGLGDAGRRGADPAPDEKIECVCHGPHYAGRSLLGNGGGNDYLGNMPQAAHLVDRAVLSVSGPEARSFLQGLITNDIERVKPGTPIYAALLTPQGKTLFDFLVFGQDGALLLDVAASQRDALQRRLTMYRLRAKVDIAARDDLAVVADWSAAGSDPRNSRLGSREIVAANIADDAGDYLAHRLSLGIPEGADFGQDRMFALDADLDELNAVSFDKGCYVGQELTARMKHRGTARKRLLPIETLDGAALPDIGSAVMAGGRDIGEVTSVYGARGFALIRLDRLEEVGDAAMQASDTGVRVVKPSWLFPPRPA